jgi:hypothetical protein
MSNIPEIGGRNHADCAGTIVALSEQYRDFKFSTEGYDDGGYWRWIGVLTINRSISMKGELTVAGEEYHYSEEQTLNGNLN